MPAGSEHVLDLDISVVTKVATGNSQPEIATSAGIELCMNPQNEVMSNQSQGGPSHLTVRRIPKNSTGSTKKAGRGKAETPSSFTLSNENHEMECPRYERCPEAS